MMEEQQAIQGGGGGAELILFLKTANFWKWKFLELILLIVVSFIVSSWKACVAKDLDMKYILFNSEI